MLKPKNIITKRVIFFIAALFLFTIGCKKEIAQKSPAAVTTTDTSTNKNLSATLASTLKGINWACPGDNFSDTTLVLSGLLSTDTYAAVYSKTDAILSGIITNTGANTIRIPINYPTVSQSWWNSYMAVIDKATSKGMNVILACWESKSSADGMIDNTAQFWLMWQTVVNKYQSNTQVYFEIFNEPHGYSLSAWTAICAQWLSNYPSVPRERILIDGTSYAQDVKGVGADSRFANCLLSIHDYAFFSNGTLTTAAQWESRLAGNVGSYGNRTVLTEFGDTMDGGINYTGAISGSQDIAYLQGLTNEVRTMGMGSVYWPGIRNGDGYALEILGGSSGSPTVSTTNPSGLSRIKYGWGMGAGGTDIFYTGAFYRFINQNSALPMDVNGASLANDANIIQWPQNGGNNQQWIITDNGGGYYKITNRNSGLALDVNGGSTTSGATLIQWPWNGGNNQQWQLAATNPGIYKVINRNSGMAVDVNGASKTNGANVVQSTWKGGADQQWQIVQQ